MQKKMYYIHFTVFSFRFVAGYLDIINTNLESDSGGTVQSLLAEVVGLIVNVETDAARSETAFLIAAIMRENPILNSVDRNQLTEVQRDELRLELATIFTNIQNAVSELKSVFCLVYIDSKVLIKSILQILQHRFLHYTFQGYYLFK